MAKRRVVAWGPIIEALGVSLLALAIARGCSTVYAGVMP